MGLDMYLWKKTYVGNKYRDEDKMVRVVLPENQEGVSFPTSEVKDERVSEIVEEVGYWRKANAIHRWFVENVQDGNDDCDDYYVSEEDLKKLLNTVETVLFSSELVDGRVWNGAQWTKEGGHEEIYEDGKVIFDSTVAERVLPTQSGCFFGSTDYDQYYIQDLEYTRELLTKLLEEEADGDFYYSSSW